MMKLRIVFMGTPDFAVPCLDNLVKAGHEIALVVTQPDRPKGRGRILTQSAVKEYATLHSLPVLQPEKIKAPDCLAQITELRPDVIVVVAFGQILSPALLAIPPLGCINVHASLLPKYRGAAPIHWAVMKGEIVTGITTMYMNEGLDTGDMILQAETTIGPEENTGQVDDRLQMLGASLLLETLSLLAVGIAPRHPQDNVRATYAPLLKREMEVIDWGRTAVEIHNQVRGLNPWPGSYCHYRDKLIKVWKTCIPDSSHVCGQPGLIVAIDQGRMLVQTGAGLIALTEVQPQSKRKMRVSEFALGYRVGIGEILQ
jgi:methionyl-tRNA formyltransferase